MPDEQLFTNKSRKTIEKLTLWFGVGQKLLHRSISNHIEYIISDMIVANNSMLIQLRTQQCGDIDITDNFWN